MERRDKNGRVEFVPGFIEAYQRTPIQTAGELPGGGALFAVCATAASIMGGAASAVQLPLDSSRCRRPALPPWRHGDTAASDGPNPLDGHTRCASCGRVFFHAEDCSTPEETCPCARA